MGCGRYENNIIKKDPCQGVSVAYIPFVACAARNGHETIYSSGVFFFLPMLYFASSVQSLLSLNEITLI